MYSLPIRDFSKKTLKIAKVIHIIAAALWLGGILCSLLIFTSDIPADIALLLNDRIDSFIVIPSAVIILLMGLYYGFFTGWGFFKRPWLLLKWLLTVLVIICGMSGSHAVPLYIFQLLVMLLIIIVSVYKPGGRKNKKQS